MSSKTLLLAVLFITYQAKAQNADMEKALADAIDIQVGGTFGKPRVSPKVEKLGIAQVSIKFKTVSTAKLNISAKKQGLLGKSSAGSRTASSTAFLNFSDQEMGPQDYQEITNHFYYTLQRKLKENGIDTVAWSNIESTDFLKMQETMPMNFLRQSRMTKMPLLHIMHLEEVKYQMVWGLLF